MSTNELKAEIQKVIDKVPDALLNDILEYLKSIQNKSADTVRLSQNLRQILNEDKELLEKLAQ